MIDVNTVVEKFKSRQALIGIVGLGYVGLPLMLRYNAIGFDVLGIDIDDVKVDKLNAGQIFRKPKLLRPVQAVSRLRPISAVSVNVMP